VKKKRDRQAKRRGEKNRGENAGLFLILLLHSLSLFTSLSLVFWIFGKVVREEKRKKKEEEKKTPERERKMTRYCPHILSTQIVIIFERLHLSLCDHLLGI
jgi:hypothetical protein